MRRTVFTGRRGLAPVLLTVVIVWALAAVLMLTGTLLAARSIKQDVGVITPEVGDIRGDTKNVELALKVKKVTVKIDKSLAPLSQELQDTLAAAKTIDVTAKSILGKARTINGSVKTINGNVLEIGTTVNSISDNARSINANAQSINASARGIGASARGINASALSVSSSVGSVLDRGRGILETVKSIEPAVAGINRRAETARRVGVTPIRNDLDAVLALVPRINSHANSIDCANVINGPSCSRTRLSASQARSNARGIYRSVFGSNPTKEKIDDLVRKAPKVKAPSPSVRDQSGPQPDTAPADDSPVAKVKDPVKAAQEVASELKTNLDAVLNLVPGLNSRTNSLVCGLIRGSACSQPR